MKSIIAGHPNKLTMERRYLQGESIMRIAKDYGVSYQSLYDHCKNRLSRQMVQAFEKKELEQNFDLLSRIDKIIIRAEKIFRRNYVDKKDVIALKALSEQRQTFELLAKISYALHQTKLADLEQTKAEQQQEDEEKFTERLKVLNFDELKLLEKLSTKLETQDKTLKIIPGLKYEQGKDEDIYHSDIEKPVDSRKTRLKRRSKSIQEPDEQINGEDDENDDSINRVQTIQPVEIPSTPWRDNPANPAYELRQHRKAFPDDK